MAKDDETTPAQDLGFGTRVGGDRLLNRDGSFTVRRTGLSFRDKLSLYHSLMTMSWPLFIGLVAAIYLLVNFLFSIGYWASGPGAIVGPGEHGLTRSFFFSVQTFSGVGYGHLSPGTQAANVIMTAQSIAGLLAVALATGLVFARFARPRAHLVFSKQALIAPYGEGWALMFRLANRRKNEIVELSTRVMLSYRDEANGTGKRAFKTLDLELNKITFFPLTWTVVHPIEGDSPLAGLDPESFLALDAEILVMLTGLDETSSQAVQARSSYKASEVVWWARFSDVYQRNEMGNPTDVDLSRLSQYESAEHPERLPAADAASVGF